MNITIPDPAGTTSHGNPNLLCTSAKWSDFLTFYFVNYFAHAASVILEPGIGLRRTLLFILAALVLPSSGISLAVSAIWRHGITKRKYPLQKAARARALCMVVKSPEALKRSALIQTPRKNSGRGSNDVIGLAKDDGHLQAANSTTQETISQKAGRREEQEAPLGHDAVQYMPKESSKDTSSSQLRSSTDNTSSHWWDPDFYEVVPSRYSIYGEYWLHCDYLLVFVPTHASLDFTQKLGGGNTTFYHQNSLLPSSYDAPKILIGIVQAISAIITTYRARGNQIDQYGYAAFGLTVVPHAFMSIINSFANLLTPKYSSLYVIRTPTVTQAEQENKGFFSAALEVDLNDTNKTAENPAYFTSIRYNNYAKSCTSRYRRSTL